MDGTTVDGFVLIFSGTFNGEAFAWRMRVNSSSIRLRDDTTATYVGTLSWGS
jgi:hypothetical protein